MTYVLGLTGSIATGKSTLSRLFKAYGFPIVDADVIAHEIVQPGTQGLTNIVTHFGPTVLQSNGQLDRKKLGQLVFADPEKRALLNQLNGPLIRQEILDQVAKLKAQAAPLVILDIPLLYESHYETHTDGVMIAYVPKALEIQRLMQRDNITEKAALQRIDSQMSIETKRKMADFCIDNTQDIAHSKAQIQRFLEAHQLI